MHTCTYTTASVTWNVSFKLNGQKSIYAVSMCRSQKAQILLHSNLLFHFKVKRSKIKVKGLKKFRNDSQLSNESAYDFENTYNNCI